MSIQEKAFKAAAYKEALKIVETQKPENEHYDLLNDDLRICGKVTYYPLENRIGILTTGNEYKIQTDLLKSLHKILGQLLGT